MNNFNPEKQYRCTIIRGKAKTDLDNLLPRYAEIIQDICPCSKDDFSIKFNSQLERIINGNTKTLDNHRTEIAGKLFGMYFVDNADIVYPSERTLKLVEDEDQPSFFKDIAFKFQFPNGMDSIHNIRERLKYNIQLRPFPFIIELLTIAEHKNIVISKNEIGYFVLNCLEVLQGRVSPQIVFKKISEYRDLNKIVKVETPGKASSFSMQHINEQLSILELANLIRILNNHIYLNTAEKKSIDWFRSHWDKSIEFDIYSYSLSSVEDRKKLLFDWQIYFSKINKNAMNIFPTTIDAIQFTPDISLSKKTASGIDKIALGDDGENYIFKYEKERVAHYDKRLVNKVLLLGKTKGLGYDVQSIFADNSEYAEFVHYIEVKATKRVTEPPLAGSDGWMDAVTLTRNEWVAAKQHLRSFSIYRVYFTPNKTIVYIIKNPFEKNANGSIKCTPINYRMDFSRESIDKIIEGASNGS